MKKAIVTLAIGEKYLNMFNNVCKTNWEAYCKKFGYDLIVLSESLDESDRAKRRSPAWQKLLILSQPWSANYDRIVWVDLDILFNNNTALDVSDNVPVEKVGAVEAYSSPSKEIHDFALHRLYSDWKKRGIPFIDNKLPSQYYLTRGIQGGDLNEVVQTGVLVCSPKYHRQIFEDTYNKYEDTKGAEWNYEMPPLSYELLKNNLVYWISPKFNIGVPMLEAAFYSELYQIKESLISKILRKLKGQKQTEIELACLKEIYAHSYFMHFSGCQEKMEYMHFVF